MSECIFPTFFFFYFFFVFIWLFICLFVLRCALRRLIATAVGIMGEQVQGTDAYDTTQLSLMREEIIVVDDNDVALRPGSKRECHVLDSSMPGDKALLHRAFSVFLFDPAGERLLLQQRSAEKITFPLFWANTCCSHPLHTSGEMEEGAKNLGVKRAAVRKLDHELGIKADQVPLEDFHYLTRIHYAAAYDANWGEHEIDHVLVIQADVELNPCPNEVKSTRWMTREELKAFTAPDATHGELISPWFLHIEKNFLYKWWDALLAGDVDNAAEPGMIHRMDE